jgi:type IV pilus assembly protein PilV
MNSVKQSGSSLIETVVALFVLSIGLLGVLSMQVKSMQFNQSAFYYGQAVYLANEILENMRSNKAVANTYLIDFDENKPSLTVNCNESGKKCTPSQLRDFDIHHWRSNIERSLVTGKSSVKRVGDFYAITVQFDDSRSAADNAEGAELSEYVLLTEI